MEGIEKITGRILADAKAEADAALTAGKDEAAALKAEYERRAEDIRSSARSAAQAECEAMLSRVEASGGNVRRNMILDEKNRLLDAAFAAAAEALPKQAGYRDFLCSLAVGAVNSNAARETAAAEEDEDFVPAEDYELILAGSDAKYRSDIEAATASAAAKAGKRIIISDGDIPGGGFILRCGSVSTDCAVRSLINEYRPEIEAGAASILFGEEK